MNKKEQKALEQKMAEEQRQKRVLRNRFLDSFTNFEKDCNAIQRVNQMNNVQTTDEMYQKALERYSDLTENGYTIKSPERGTFEYYVRNVYWFMRQTNENRYVDNDSLVVDDLAEDGLEHIALIATMRKFGYSKINYQSTSSRCYPNLCNLIGMGCKVDGVRSYKKYGARYKAMVLDITDADLDLCLANMCFEEKDELTTHNNEWGRATKQEDLDAIDNKYNAFKEKVSG